MKKKHFESRVSFETEVSQQGVWPVNPSVGTLNSGQLNSIDSMQLNRNSKMILALIFDNDGDDDGDDERDREKCAGRRLSSTM